MCEVEHGFKFCTCTAAAATTAAPAKLPDYRWSLVRYAGTEDIGIMGSIVGPSADLGKGLTRQNVLDVLNNGNGFDFEYSPAEQDCLRIDYSTAREYAYMSFLYENGQWIEGMHPPFTTKLEAISSGKIEPLNFVNDI